jgi:hypothetical protein
MIANDRYEGAQQPFLEQRSNDSNGAELPLSAGAPHECFRLHLRRFEI